ncbi:MAG: YfhO family protein [Candidatus Kuenenia sp.]|nr:YfhO family protein [Candidatus Kuenenia hertensis]
MNKEQKINKNHSNYSASILITNPSEAWSKYDWYAILTLFLLTLAYFHKVVIPFDTSILSDQNTDTRHQLFYWRYFGFNTLANGTLPLWNPYIYSGSPFVGGIQSALFYPLNLIFLIFPIHVAINYSIILHVFLSGVFTYLYVRYLRFFREEKQNSALLKNEEAGGLTRTSCMISAIIFMFCAPQIFHVYPGHLPNLCTMIWLPLVLLFSELFLRTRRLLYAFLGGIVVACNILAGHPQYFFYTAIAVSLYFIIRILQEVIDHKSLKAAGYSLAGFCIIYVTGFFLSLIQLLPAIEMVKHSARQSLTYEWVGQFSFLPENFITLFLPDFFGDLFNAPYWGRCYLWEMSLYLGIPSLMLCGIASFNFKSGYTRIFLIIALITTILALGKFTPLFKILYAVVPGFNMFRGNSKFIFIVAFSLSVLAGFGLEYLQNVFAKKMTKTFLFITIGIAAAISMFLIIFFLFHAGFGAWHAILHKIYTWGDRYTTLPDLNNANFLRTTFIVARKSAIKVILVAILSLLIIGLWINGRLNKKALIPLTIALLFGDLWMFGNRYMVTFDPKECFWNKEVTDILKKDPAPSRITTAGHFELNQGMAHNIANIGGYDANVIKEYSEFVNLLSGKPIEQPNIVMEVSQISKLTNLLTLRYLLLPANMRINHPGFTLLYNDAKYALFENLHALPQSFVVHKAKELHGRDTIFKELSGNDFQPKEYIVVEEPVPPVRISNSQNIQNESVPEILEYTPNSVTIRASLLEDGYLVLSDTYYPGWNAYVDGKQSKIYKTNYVIRSVFLEKGEHIVKFIYEPMSFVIGMIISLSALILIIPACIYLVMYRKKSKEYVST